MCSSVQCNYKAVGLHASRYYVCEDAIFEPMNSASRDCSHMGLNSDYRTKKERASTLVIARHVTLAYN